MAIAPNADHVTVHYHQGPETNSQAAASYGAAFMLVSIGMSALGYCYGYIKARARENKRLAEEKSEAK